MMEKREKETERKAKLQPPRIWRATSPVKLMERLKKGQILTEKLNYRTCRLVLHSQLYQRNHETAKYNEGKDKYRENGGFNLTASFTSQIIKEIEKAKNAERKAKL